MKESTSFSLDPNKVVVPPLPVEKPVVTLKPGRYNEVENRLSDTLFRAVNFIEQFWWEHSELPSLALIEQKAGITKQESETFWKNDDVIESLRKRNLDPEVINNHTEILTREQLIVANMVLNIADKRSIREKLKDVGIKPAAYQAWMNDPTFVGYVRRRAEQLFNTADSKARLALVEGIEAGDFQSTKLYLEMRGLYNPRVDINLNVEQVLVRVVDIIARHVDDAVVLEAIATEIEGLAGNKTAIPVAGARSA